jgi:cytoskeleton protein RodZ
MLGSMTDDHDPAEALMREVGAQLRQVRLERGEELDEVAHNLRIKTTYLFGIEQGDLSKLPGRTYALGFLRSYADYLGFDGDDLIVQIKSTVANLTDRTRLRIRTPLPESRLPQVPILVLSVAAIAGVYAGWSYLNRSSQVSIEPVSEVPSELRSLAGDALREDGAGPPPAPGVAEPVAPAATPENGPQGRPGGASVPQDVADPRVVDGGARPADPGAVGDPVAPEMAPEAGPSATTRAFAAAQPEAADADGGAGEEEVAALPFDFRSLAANGRLYEADNTDARVVLRALESSWIRVSSAGGDYQRDQTLEPGDVFLVPNRPDLELWTGNAGGLEVIVDGDVLAPLGTSGAVVRAVALDPANLRARLGGPIVR